MKKSLFITKKNKVRTIINIKNNNTIVKFKIYEPTNESIEAIFEMYKTKDKLGLEDFSLSENELRLVFNLFTDCLFTVEELCEILEDPSIYMKQIMNELELLLGEIAILYVQEKRKEVMQLNLEEANLDIKQALLETMKKLDI